MSIPKDFDTKIRKYALHNASQFKGKANPGAVIGKVLAENPKLKSMVDEVAKAVHSVVKEVNKLKVEKQIEELNKEAPELLEKKKVGKREIPELKNAVKGKVVTRIPPEPSKYAHIGHALSFLINYMYAKKYNGKCYVRFEDTNPELAKQEYVDAMTDDIEYLGIEPTKVTYVSDDVKIIYSYAEKMIKLCKAYVCTCNQEKMRELRREGFGCAGRDKDVKTNLERWKEMLKGEVKAGEAVLRLKGDMKSKNYVMRDPVLFKISDKEHYSKGKKFHVWPLYDIANSVEDGMNGVTHIMRSIEFGSMRTELQDTIKDILKLPKQTVIQYGRFNVPGAATKGREIRRLIEDGSIGGWDDPRLVTIKALRRRGIQPETFWDLAIEVGLSPTVTNLDWQLISAFNRKILDPKCNRYFFIENPKEITIKGSVNKKVELKLHPDIESDEKRKFYVNDKFYIASTDFEEISKLKNGSLIRLMDCLNFKKEGNVFTFDSVEIGKYRAKGKRIIHWVPCEEKKLVKVKVLMPEGTETKGIAEPSIEDIKVGDIVQFARFGFCRLEHRNGNSKSKELEFIYCHR
jgi:glutamyl-tRNA synthetase